ncbi:MAG TPA: hypothetical protein VEV41_01710, partial [Terriglobales bacterium]|nr:hypothetical protein [Terriglobales bacterium]
ELRLYWAGRLYMSDPQYRALRVVLGFLSLLMAIGGVVLIFSSKALILFGLGGSAGSGLQFVSWIHDADFVRSIDYLIGRDGIDGIVNVASPNPLPNREFMKALRQAWGVGIGLPAASWMLEIGKLDARNRVGFSTY